VTAFGAALATFSCVSDDEKFEGYEMMMIFFENFQNRHRG
jgi:hypothetical protein